VAGVGVGIYAAVRSARTTVPAPAVAEPSESPYESFVAGAGLVEANTENISIGTQIPGIVSKIYVQIGSEVKKGDPFFTIDDRAQLALVATLRAGVDVAAGQLANATNELALALAVKDSRAVSVETIDQRRYAAQIAVAQLAQARAQLSAAEVDLDRLTVRAPMDGQVLQLKVRLGEYAPTGVLAQALILFGGVNPINVRIDVDENDAWRVRPEARATAFLRGNRAASAPLKFVRFEPYVIPKVSLTGAATERVDTRVLEVVYSFQRGKLPFFAGNQVDVFIEAPGGAGAKEPARPATQGAP
jgi:RND family efflux transporter MFP subunit